MHMMPSRIAGTPSMMNMKRQPAKFSKIALPLEISHEETGVPTTLESGMASMNRAVARARIEVGNQ